MNFCFLLGREVGFEILDIIKIFFSGFKMVLGVVGRGGLSGN